MNNNFVLAIPSTIIGLIGLLFGYLYAYFKNKDDKKLKAIKSLEFSADRLKAIELNLNELGISIDTSNLNSNQKYNLLGDSLKAKTRKYLIIAITSVILAIIIAIFISFNLYINREVHDSKNKDTTATAQNSESYIKTREKIIQDSLKKIEEKRKTDSLILIDKRRKAVQKTIDPLKNAHDKQEKLRQDSIGRALTEWKKFNKQDGIFSIENVYYTNSFLSSDDKNVFHTKSSDSFNQKWRIERIANNTYLIINPVNGKVLDNSASVPDRVQLWNKLVDNPIKNSKIPNANNQKWIIEEADNGNFRILNLHRNYLVLDASKGKHSVVQMFKNLENSAEHIPNANNQKWKISRIE